MPHKDPEKYKQYQAAYRLRTQEAKKIKHRAWYERNRSRVLAHAKLYRENNIEVIDTKKKQYYLKNRDKILTQLKVYHQSKEYQAKKHRWRLNREYKLTCDQYDKMLASQGGVCAVCKRICTAKSRLGVDHDHATGIIRGLLCGKCNSALGLLGDSAERVEALADYIRTYEVRKAG